MTPPRPTTIADYIAAAPAEGQAHLHKTTKGTLQLAYAEPLPEELIRQLAQYSLELVRERDDDAFW